MDEVQLSPPLAAMTMLIRPWRNKRVALAIRSSVQDLWSVRLAVITMDDGDPHLI